jgi:hypothetical protein
MPSVKKIEQKALSKELSEGIPDAGMYDEDVPRIRKVAGASNGP